jgi:hypothetical protein
MMTHLHPPTSSSPLDLVREGFNLFVLGSGYQLGPSLLSRLFLSIPSGYAPACSRTPQRDHEVAEGGD